MHVCDREEGLTVSPGNFRPRNFKMTFKYLHEFEFNIREFRPYTYKHLNVDGRSAVAAIVFSWSLTCFSHNLSEQLINLEEIKEIQITVYTVKVT